MKKTVKAWAVVGEGADTPVLLSISETEDEAKSKIERFYGEPFSIWTRNGYSAQSILITYDDGRGQQRRRGTR